MTDEFKKLSSKVGGCIGQFNQKKSKECVNEALSSIDKDILLEAINRDSFNQFIEGYEDYHGYGGIAKFIHHECLYNTNFKEGDYSDVSLLTKYGFSCHGLENNESNECITTAYNQICSTSNHGDL